MRSALGATASDLARLVVRGGTTPVVVGLIIGGYGAIGLTRWLQDLLFEIHPTDPGTMAAAAAILAIVAWAACHLPARRASRVDPMKSLRTE